jgi:hypothetical protein
MRHRLAAAADAALALAAWTLTFTFFSALLSRDTYHVTGEAGRVGVHIRNLEFDFFGWTLNAIRAKVSQAALDAHAYLAEAERSALVVRYFDLRRQLEQVEGQIARAFGDPAITDPDAATAAERAEAQALRAEMGGVQPAAEAILQEQLSVILAAEGLTILGQPVPPVAFQLTPLPYALIVSPRDVIRVDVNVDVVGTLTLDERVHLEERVARDLDVSALTVPLGGIGTYPTMVGESSNLSWIASVTAHEWLHNYLTQRPLGLNYMTSPALRTMNETTAEMIGDELGALLIARYYPDLAPPPRPYPYVLRRDAAPPEERRPPFDFRAEMHETRVTADRLLTEGRIPTAEAYMEARRRYLWANGYQIRKLNQAYFAFYGAYAAGGGGAAGADPVSEAVRLLRRRSPTIAEFVNTMAWFTSYEQMRDHLGLPE